MEQDEDGYPPYAVENLWALRRADGFELDNVPWYAKRVASGDLINAQPDADGRLVFSSVIRRGGNSTLRGWLADAVDLSTTSRHTCSTWRDVRNERNAVPLCRCTGFSNHGRLGTS
ncbi:MAG: DUF4265 domain-containing protein [Bryobacteraceae bacterium]|nr:DUF4265 domain-containing protein [Bryobacteraceae bacterium]